MTLILGMSKDEGIYLSVDYRVSDARTGRLLDDSSSKFLTVRYPPDNGGPTAVLAYTGLAILPDGTPTGDWMRETLRGESEVFDVSMAHLLHRLNRDIAPRRVPLIINALVVQGSKKFLGAFSNVATEEQQLVTRSEFGYLMQELSEPFAFANGSGAARAAADKHFDRIRSQLNVRPRKTEDHMGLLASVNRRVAAQERTVSPFCHVTFVNADDRTGPESKVFIEKGETVPFSMPYLLFGVDLDVLTRGLHETAEAMMRGDDVPEQPDRDTVNEELRRRP